ncbi:MAG: IS3 family transposase, partial [Clostridiales bacterium]|nr:IS3 family transposase [Clostridiales bacterium]
MRAVSQLRSEFSFELLLKLADIPRSTYYYILNGLSKPDRHGSLRESIRAICVQHSGRYGYRRVTMALRKQGILANHKLVMRLMKEEGLTSLVRMKKYRSYRGEVGRIAPHLLQRDFHADLPNQKWVTDLTEFSLFGEKLYLSPILDLYNAEIVSYTLSSRPALDPVLTMLRTALTLIPENPNLILNSDQGWQYQPKSFQKLLREKGVAQSMSRKGNCLDNSVMENFLGLLKSELLYLRSFDSMEHFRIELIRYIDYYNNDRIKLKLKGM